MGIRCVGRAGEGQPLSHVSHAIRLPGRLAGTCRALPEASPESDVAGYEIVFRETISPFWQDAIDVGNTTEGTLELSKDNWFFGVRAYDNEGYRSPVAFPIPARE